MTKPDSENTDFSSPYGGSITATKYNYASIHKHEQRNTQLSLKTQKGEVFSTVCYSVTGDEGFIDFDLFRTKGPTLFKDKEGTDKTVETMASMLKYSLEFLGANPWNKPPRLYIIGGDDEHERKASKRVINAFKAAAKTATKARRSDLRKQSNKPELA